MKLESVEALMKKAGILGRPVIMRYLGKRKK